MEEEEISYFTADDKNRILQMWKETPMRTPKIIKVTVHMGVGSSGERLEKAMAVLENITKQKPVKMLARKTIRDFGIRKYEPITAKVTLRGKKGVDFLKRALTIVDNKIKFSCLDDHGNFSFGIKEHIELPETTYDPALGIFGLDITVNLEHPGHRVSRRRKYSHKVKNYMTKLETMVFLDTQLGTKIIKEYVTSYY